MKRILILLLFSLCLLQISCSFSSEDDKIIYNPPMPEEIKNFTDIEAIHQMTYEDVSSYILIKTKPINNNICSSLTLYMNFKLGDRVDRKYDYFQIDYSMDKINDIQHYYHVFDNIDGYELVYAQNFLPYYNLKSLINNIKVKVLYTFKLKDKDTNDLITYQKELSYNEDIINLNDKNSFIVLNEENRTLNEQDFIIQIIDNTITSEDENRFKLDISFNEELNGHFDFQSWIEYEDEITPFIGIYNYHLDKGRYTSVPDEKISKQYEIKGFYYQINHYQTDNKVTTYKYYIQNS